MKMKEVFAGEVRSGGGLGRWRNLKAVPKGKMREYDIMRLTGYPLRLYKRGFPTPLILFLSLWFHGVAFEWRIDLAFVLLRKRR